MGIIVAKCRVCGAAHRACGPKSTVIPVDQIMSTARGGQMSLKEYGVTVGRRNPHKTTMLLTESEAKRLGGVEVKAGKPASNKQKQAPANKAAKAPVNKQKQAPTPAPAVPAGADGASDPGASEA